jgi:hypothetical protein
MYKIEREEKKQIGLKKNLLSSLIVSGKKLSKSNFKIPGDKSTSIKDMLNKVSFKFVEKKSKIQTVSKKSQSLLDFERKTDETDIQQQQLDVLKEIDKKLINLSFNGSGSWLDSLFEGVGNLVSGILGGALGVGRIGGLAGLGGLFKGKLGGLAKVGKVGLKVAKNPIALGAVVVGFSSFLARVVRAGFAPAAAICFSVPLPSSFSSVTFSLVPSSVLKQVAIIVEIFVLVPSARITLRPTYFF